MPDQADIARAWLMAIEKETRALADAGRPLHAAKEVLVLREDKSIGWEDDKIYESIMRLAEALPAE